MLKVIIVFSILSIVVLYPTIITSNYTRYIPPNPDPDSGEEN